MTNVIIMGNLLTTKLVCPSGYDVNKFNYLIQLFDVLDRNGDHVIDIGTELEYFTDRFYAYYVKHMRTLIDESYETEKTAINILLKIITQMN